jgi:hypothetical protein
MPVAIFTLLASTGMGCARLAGVMPSASPVTATSAPREMVSDLAGQWVGAVTGTEFGGSDGEKAEWTFIAINGDGTWTARAKLGSTERTEAGTVKIAGTRVLLDGTIVTGSGAGGAVRYDLMRRGNGLYGVADSTYAGESMRVPARFQKTA